MTITGTSTRVVAIALSLLSMVTSAAAQGNRPNYTLWEDPRDRFSIEFPKDWSWTLITPSGEPIAIFTERGRSAAVIVERFRSRIALAPEEITDVTADLEAGLLKENQPTSSDVTVKIVSFGRRRIIVLDYTRPGLKEAERVRQYTFLVGSNVYRVSCFSLRRLLPDYMGVCESMAESFRPAGEPTSSAR